VIQAAVVVADQGQVVPLTATLKAPSPPSAVGVASAGSMPTIEQGAAA
jgi:hypothetical protein